MRYCDVVPYWDDATVVCRDDCVIRMAAGGRSGVGCCRGERLDRWPFTHGGVGSRHRVLDRRRAQRPCAVADVIAKPFAHARTGLAPMAAPRLSLGILC